MNENWELITKALVKRQKDNKVLSFIFSRIDEYKIFVFMLFI